MRLHKNYAKPNYLVTIRKLTVAFFFLLVSSAIAFAQNQMISSTDYEKAFEKAEKAATYPYRETIKFEPFTSYDSGAAGRNGNGVEIRSQVVTIEYSSPDRLRITTDTDSENGRTVKRQMQIHGDCYTLAGAKWKKNTESCGDAVPLTMEMAPNREEFFVEEANLSGARQRIFRHVQTKGYGRDETSFTLDDRGRLIRREESGRTRTYDYGARIEPVVAPYSKRLAKRKR